jgi:hypothetical protein
MEKFGMNYSTRPALAILSGRFPPTRFSSAVNHKAYAERHGYTYIHANWPTGAMNPFLNKLKYIQEYYRFFDYLFWIDDDAFFLDQSHAIDSFFDDQGVVFTACRSPTVNGIHTVLSSGQFLLRCSSLGRDLIDGVAQTDLEMVRNWWRISSEDLGFFTNGDQDAFVFHYMTNQKFQAAMKLLPAETFNSRFGDILDPKQRESVFVLHFTGKKSVKWRKYRRAMKILHLGPELLPVSELVRLRVQKTNAVGRLYQLAKRFIKVPGFK